MADFRNAEGYADPTAYGAFCAIEKEEKALRAFRPIVYICSPYAGDVENNTAAARRYSRFAVEAGYIPIAPHLLFPQFLDDKKPKERELGLFFGNAILSNVRKCGFRRTHLRRYGGRNQKSHMEGLSDSLFQRDLQGGITMRFTLYRADRLGMPENCVYPHKVAVTDKNTLLQAVSYDYVCAEYRGSYRNNDNFLGADCLPVDCDNDHSDDPENWVYPSDVATAFPGVAFAVHYSRSHMKVKNGKEARPKFHVLFPIDRLTDAAQYSDLKKLVNTLFPYFDTKALDAARFFFGTEVPQVDIFDGPMMLTTFLADDDFDANMDSGSYGSIIIPEGSRNATMSHYAGRILKRFGNTEEARKHFTEVAACCQPPLEQSELDSIWRSAQRFYGKISAQDATFRQSSTTRSCSSSRPTILMWDRPLCFQGNTR